MLKTALTVDQVLADLSRYAGYLPVGWWGGQRAKPVVSVAYSTSSRGNTPSWILLTEEAVPDTCEHCDLPEGHGGICVVMKGLWRIS